MDFPTRDKDPGRWEVDEDPTSHSDRMGEAGTDEYDSATSDAGSTGSHASGASGVGADTGKGENPYGSTTGATANRHSAGPSGLGQSSGSGGDVLRDAGADVTSGAHAATDADFGARPGMPSGDGGSFSTADPGMADQPVEGGESDADQ